MSELISLLLVGGDVEVDLIYERLDDDVLIVLMFCKFLYFWLFLFVCRIVC